MKHIKNFESEFSTVLTERELMIFNYAYNACIKDLKESDEVNTVIKKFSMSQKESSNLYDNIRSLCKILNLEYDLQYLNMSFGFPYNTCHYRITITGKNNNIEEFFDKF